MTEKMTKREKFNRILTFEEVKADAEMVEFIQHEIELLDRKNKNKGKPTAQQKKDNEIREKILEILVEPMTATQIQKAVEGYFTDIVFSNQKVVALVNPLMDSGQVERIVVKRKPYFQRVEG